MKKNRRSLNRLIALTAIVLIFVSCSSQPKDLKEALQKLSEIPVKSIEADSIYKEAFEVYFTQNIDHNDKKSATFSQKVYVNHIDYTKPTVVILEGYTANSNYKSELSDLLNANQIIIEHRFYGKSSPDSIPWDLLTVKQAAIDQHNIIQALKKLYTGKWISTGISKGGQTTIFHRSFFPKDVFASVPYVAPLNFEREDPRIHEHLKNVGTQEEREKVKTFQKELFERKNEILPLLKIHADDKKLDFDRTGIERAYDLNVLEYSFAFWQWNTNTKEIPKANASDQELFDHWKSTAPFSFFAKDESGTELAFTFQALYEIGFYSYEIDDFKEYLSDTIPATMDFKLPEYMRREYKPEVMASIHNWVKNESSHMLYIVGEYDPWGATAVNPSNNALTVKMVNPKGSHRTRIKSFPEDMKENIYKLLENWMDVEIKR